MFAGGGSAGNGGAAEIAGIDKDIGFDGGIAARIENLAGVDFGDLRGHC